MKLKNHFFTADFTDAAPFLKDKPVGYVFKGEVGSKLADILKVHDRRPSTQDRWCCMDDGAEFNVQGATVAFNGPNSSLYRTNSRFDRVLVLALPHRGECQLYLQYNEET